MRAVKYFTNVLSDGHLPIPEEVKREFGIRRGEKLEVILSYVPIKNKEDEIKTLQKKIQEEALRKTKKKLTILEINRFVHKLRKVNV
jgi:bifunctional DNA-binding transcriptional regulator/antitoxin component of YhaV-PrlF toxin-antitoxin module